MQELVAARNPEVAKDAVFGATLNYVAVLCCALIDIKNFEFDEWNGCAVAPYLSQFLSEEDSEAVTR